MNIFNILGWIILTIICLTIAPLITIGFILIKADDLGSIGDILGVIFIIAGIFRMFVNILKD